MTKKVIAIVSVLKPVDDVRNFRKLARSLSNTNKYEINIIGFSAINIPQIANIHFWPVFNFKRTNLHRLAAPLKIMQILLKLKPELIIVTTPELLIVSIVNKILFGTKLIYDIQENYLKNILYTSTYPIYLRHPIAWMARTVERLSTPFIDHFIAAEKIYPKQMTFIHKKYTVLENKAVLAMKTGTSSNKNDQQLKLVYSGTIAPHYGIFESVEFTKQLYHKKINVKLTIIGFAALKNTYEKLQRISSAIDYVKLIGGTTLVPHDQILMCMKEADFCLLPYQSNKSTEGRIPTKLYQCLAMEKPVIISPNDCWNDLIKKNNAGIIHNFQSPVEPLLEKINNQFYGNGLAREYLWSNSEEQLLSLVNLLI